MTDPLPGMPVRFGDRGVFICGPGDLEPWDTGRARVPAAPGTRPAPVHGVWLVLRECCGAIYCRRHDADNFWLTVYDGPPFTRKDTR